MKKIASIFFALSFAVLANGQDMESPTTTNTAYNPQSQKVRLGLSFSPVVSWFSASGDAGTVEPDGTRFNIAFGLNTDFRIGENSNYYFSTGLFLLNTGGTIVHDYFVEQNGNYLLTRRTSDFRINYVNVPLTVMLRTNEIGYIRYFGRVGFDAAFNTNSTFDYEDYIEDEDQTISVGDEDASDFTALFRAGLHIEAGFEYSLGGTTNLYFSATYNNGLNNIFSDDYRLPTGATQEGSDRLAIDPDTQEPFVERRVKASSNQFMLTVGAYF